MELKKIEENSFESDKVVKAMRKAGYEWSEETHQLKKIEQKTAEWSKEDERLRRKLLELIYSVSYCDERENLSNWLKSLKPQPKQVWSEEDEIGWTNTMIMIKEVASHHYTKDSIKLVIDWLESLRQRIGG